MNRELAVRGLGLYGPIVIAAIVWTARRVDDPRVRVDPRRLGAAVLVASGWCASALLVLHLVATRVGWWRFHVSSGTVLGIPIDLYLGWLVLWGVIPALAWRSVPLSIVALAFLWLDVLVMPLATPVVALGRAWLVGEVVAIAFVLIPALYLARWTIANTHLRRRALSQVVAYTGLVFFLIPSAIMEQAEGSWAPLLTRSMWWNKLLAEALAIPVVLGLSAVQEFVTRGNGTPIPYDPPGRLVTSGPYAYVANPMQLATMLAFGVWAVMLENPWILGACVMTLAYGSGLARWNEHVHLTERFGAAWADYRRDVRYWWPRWRPPAPRQHARLYVAESCPACRGVGQWLFGRGLIGLDVLDAEGHPTRTLSRMTYEPADGGDTEEGVAAFARALEHVNLAWAWLGMAMRLPVVRPVLQLLTDASGGHARRVIRRATP